MNRASQSRWIIALAAVAVLSWQVGSRWWPHPALAETNYHANRLRLEAWFLDPVPSNVLAGSSISGRLLPSYFAGTPLASMANLGLDGSGPLTALDCLLRRATNDPAGAVPHRIFLEIHRLDRVPDANDRLLLETADDASLTLARTVPATRAANRPSTLAYAWLKERRPGGGTGVPEPGGDSRVLLGDEPWLDAVMARVAALRRLGCEVWLLRLPVGRENPSEAAAANFADALARRTGLGLVDLFRHAQTTGARLDYTDGLHLTPAAARWVAGALAEAVAAPTAR
jgi:hypothetical protein